MPFTIDGQWVPNKPKSCNSKQIVKVRIVKRRNNLITVISHLSLSPEEIQNLSSIIKKSLGCGGAIKDCEIEIQGNKAEEVKKFLLARGITSIIEKR